MIFFPHRWALIEHFKWKEMESLMNILIALTKMYEKSKKYKKSWFSVAVIVQGLLNIV